MNCHFKPPSVVMLFVLLFLYFFLVSHPPKSLFSKSRRITLEALVLSRPWLGELMTYIYLETSLFTMHTLENHSKVPKKKTKARK